MQGKRWFWFVIYTTPKTNPSLCGTISPIMTRRAVLSTPSHNSTLLPISIVGIAATASRTCVRGSRITAPGCPAVSTIRIGANHVVLVVSHRNQTRCSRSNSFPFGIATTTFAHHTIGIMVVSKSPSTITIHQITLLVTRINMLAECRWVTKSSLALIALIMPCATQMLWQGAFCIKFFITYPAFKCHKSTSMFNFVPCIFPMLHSISARSKSFRAV